MTHGDDAFGQALRDHLDGLPGELIVERDDGFIAPDLGLPHYFSDFATWPKQERQAIRYVRGRVLDVGCGAGRVALYLQKRGHDVCGIDVSPLAVEVCRERGVRDVRRCSVTQASRAGLGSFDTVVLYGNNLGLFATARRARWLLRRFHALTSDEGRIVGETLDPYDTQDADHLAYHRRNRRRGRMGGQIRLRIRYRRLADPWFDYLFVSRTELEGLVRGTGWQVDRYVDSDGAVYVAVLAKL